MINLDLLEPVPCKASTVCPHKLVLDSNQFSISLTLSFDSAWWLFLEFRCIIVLLIIFTCQLSTTTWISGSSAVLFLHKMVNLILALNLGLKELKCVILCYQFGFFKKTFLIKLYVCWKNLGDREKHKEEI